MKIGDHVVFVDSLGKERQALVTNVFGPYNPEADEFPCINVVFVNDDANQTDTYGRKLERLSSVVHVTRQYAHGNYWKLD